MNCRRSAGQDWVSVTADIQDQARMMPKKVLIVAPSLEMVGGQSIQASRLLEYLGGEQGVKADLLSTYTPLPKRLRPILKVKYLRTCVNFPLYVLRLLMRLSRYEVVHAFSAHNTSFLLAPTPALLLAKACGKVSILHYHSGFAEEHLRSWGKIAIPIMRLADAIIVPSDFLVDVFGKFGLKARAIFNIVDTDRFKFRVRNPLLPRFLSNRALESSYNVACSMKAFALVQKRFPDASLSVAGDGPQRKELEALASSLALKNVRFLGSIPHQKMPVVYDEACIFINSPDADNMPNSIIEAFASGLPVISTNAGGIPYIVTHEKTGLLVDINDHEAMARQAVRLLENESLSEKIITAARGECSNYRWDAVRRHWLDLYRGIWPVGG